VGACKQEQTVNETDQEFRAIQLKVLGDLSASGRLMVVLAVRETEGPSGVRYWLTAHVGIFYRLSFPDRREQPICLNLVQNRSDHEGR
jgi:hypothetical protein